MTNGLYLAQQTQGRSRDHLHTYLRYFLNRVIPSVECPERGQSLSGSKPHLQVVGKPRSPQSELLRMVSLQSSLLLVVQPCRLPAEVVYEVCPQRMMLRIVFLILSSFIIAEGRLQTILVTLIFPTFKC